VLLCCVAMLAVLHYHAPAAPSRHYGCAGELWNPTGRLPADWSFAGYQNGDVAIPTVPVVANVRDYGAKGDNRTDDTAAFLAAINDPKVRLATPSLHLQPTSVPHNTITASLLHCCQRFVMKCRVMLVRFGGSAQL